MIGCPTSRQAANGAGICSDARRPINNRPQVTNLPRKTSRGAKVYDKWWLLADVVETDLGTGAEFARFGLDVLHQLMAAGLHRKLAAPVDQ